jgi:hypothetical protein
MLGSVVQLLPSSLYTLCQSHDFEMLVSLALFTRMKREFTEIRLLVLCLPFRHHADLTSYRHNDHSSYLVSIETLQTNLRPSTVGRDHKPCWVCV